ncbi:MAG: hypothetical protein K0U66_07470 [Gammaproteobacteria bacterium]|nr:hypothetical protein [Gammaproteobacteria bacterium]
MLEWLPISGYKMRCQAGEVVLTDAGLGYLDTSCGMGSWVHTDIHGNPVRINDKYTATFESKPTRYASLREARKALQEAY